MTDGDPVAASIGIAIVGIAGRFPGADDVLAFWRNLEAGIESIERLIEGPLREAAPEGGQRVPAKGILADADCFDAAFFGLSARAAELLDPQQRLFLECAWQALEDAGAVRERAGERTGVFAGLSTVSSYYHAHLLANRTATASADPFQMMLSNQPSGVANLVSYRLNLTGPSLALHTACSTGLAAVSVACSHLLEGQCDLAVAGAASLSLPLRTGYWHLPGGILSPDGHCRPFAADAQGTVPGNGVAAVALRRLDDAQRDGDHIYAVIRGFALANDGADKIGFTAPGIRGQARVVAEALAMAGFPASTISYIEAHGTGTSLGDAIEIEALCRVFGRNGRPPCAIGSVKSNIGHLDTAAGIAGLVKLALMLDRRTLVPSLHAAPPSPHLDGTPFVVNDRRRSWLQDGHPPRAGISSFGMGGTNVHLVLEAAPTLAARADGPALPVLLTLSGRTPDALTRLAGHLAETLALEPTTPLADVAATLQRARQSQPHRLALVCRDGKYAVDRLREVGAGAGPSGRPVAPARAQGLVFLLPGQGAQVPGMGRRLHATEPPFRDALETCLGLLEREGVELAPLLLGAEGGEAAAARLRETALAQPAVFAVSYAMSRLLDDWGVRPAAMIGHSVGEYTAACLAGVLTLEDTARVLAARGRLLQSLPRGAMLSVALSARTLEARLEGQDVVVAACNAADSAVLSGLEAAVEAWGARFEREGVACRRLATSHAFHSGMMDPALTPYRALMAEMALRPPNVPYVSGLTGDWLDGGAAVDPDYYARHLRQPVRFTDGIATLLRHGYRRFLEIGPGSALMRLALRHRLDEERPAAFATMPDARHDDRAAPLAALGGLWAHGHDLDWRRIDPEARRVTLPPYPFERSRHWVPAPGEVDVRTASPSPPVSAPPATAPDRLAAEIAEVWREQLGYPQIAPDDDFHALGGDSLLAVRVAAALSRRYAVALRPHALIEDPTPRALARRIAAARTAPERPFMLVVLQAGSPGRAPLFLPHAVGGTVDFYRDLAAALDPSQPVHALQAQALDGVTPPARTVEALATACVAIIRTVQPGGPYRLAGSSFGGMLAYEISQLLAAQGEAVELLALIDTPAMEELPPVLADDADIVGYVAGLLGATLTPAELRPLPREAMVGRLIERCAAALPPGITLAELDLHLRVFEANTAAMRAYRIAPYRQPGRVVFFRASERDARTPAHPERPWRLRLGDRLEVVEVTGGHLTMMRPPHVEAMATRIGRALAAS